MNSTKLVVMPVALFTGEPAPGEIRACGTCGIDCHVSYAGLASFPHGVVPELLCLMCVIAELELGHGPEVVLLPELVLEAAAEMARKERRGRSS